MQVNLIHKPFLAGEDNIILQDFYYQEIFWLAAVPVFEIERVKKNDFSGRTQRFRFSCFLTSIRNPYGFCKVLVSVHHVQ